jgi:hypothetical protein
VADEQKSLTDVAKNTGELLQEAGTKTTQTVLAHTENIMMPIPLSTKS